jgi:hypothetical protein
MCHFCQIHKCSDYCMRDIKKKENGEKRYVYNKENMKKILVGKNGNIVFSENRILTNFYPNSVILQIYGRQCRAGCGKESKKGLCDTIG